MRLRLDIAYDGSDFRGWAKQPGLRTVQGVLEDALGKIVGSSITIVVAGRTDAGVHATGQVAHVDLDEHQQARALSHRASDQREPVGRLADKLRGVLGPYADMTVRAVTRAPEGFDARFSAVWRRYEYRLADDISGYDVFERNRTTVMRGVHDVDRMNDAASRLIGLHDFAAYCKPRDEATTIRTLLEYEWRRAADGTLIAHLQADAFCHSMVRALVGACAAVGTGRLEPEDVVTLRDARVRSSAFPVLVARGLTLAEVGYPADDLLAARAEQTRARREI
ncbi:tRNA pseudouridine(38-40) synthase TruA [Microbacterium sp. ZW T5_56]|uniref:tRNA pseudouridine(38-40) synthase TruA n=1 Tax=Microbacterium sp. ZW T5_56 TaxID=3378081 RepID=UPI00385365CF